jgi:hypothetical protein
MKKLKNILAENMHRFGTKNVNEVDTYVASTQGPFNEKEIKIYEHILSAMELCIPNVPADAIDDFTDNNDKQYYIDEFKKIIDAVQKLANQIETEMHRD